MIKMVLLGPPGVGKGTQAALLKKHYSIPILSTGELLRHFIKSQEQIEDVSGRDPILQEIKRNVESGELVSDDIMEKIFKKRFSSKECNEGFILDGFPRTINQAERLKHILISFYNDSAIAIINLIVDEVELIRRLNSRFICIKCNKIYNDFTLQPRRFGTCDICESNEFTKRIDDKPEIIKTRMEVYNKQTKPLINYYISSPFYKEIDGMSNIEHIFEQITKFLDYKFIS